MKTIFIFIASLLFGNVFSQEITEKEIKTDVNNVTVFIEGAQVTRKKAVEVLPGITMLKFVNLSPFIDAKSVQVKANGEVTVLSVNHQQNFMDKTSKLKEIDELQLKDKQLTEKINVENAHLSVIKEELEFLKQNRSIGGTCERTTATCRSAGARTVRATSFRESRPPRRMRVMTSKWSGASTASLSTSITASRGCRA